jgi:hypothetical protein
MSILPILFFFVCFLLVAAIAFITVILKRLLQFDQLLEFLVDDIDTNFRYIKKLANTPTFENSPEILEAQRNFAIMSQRLEEFSLRIRETRKEKN